MSDNDKEPKIRPSAGYRCLHSFWVTTLIYDATVDFTERFVDKKSRLVDQMVQAARSGRQNIAEGSRASATSSQTELRLVNVARASLDELLLDYEDFLRQRGLCQWAKDTTEALEVRGVGRALRRVEPGDRSDPTDRFARSDDAHRRAYARWLTHRDSAVVANAIICLIHQANYLLDQQISGLERSFIAEGGYSERLAAARLAARGQGRDPLVGAGGQAREAVVAGGQGRSPAAGAPAASAAAVGAAGGQGQSSRGRWTPWPRRVTRDEHGQPFPPCPRCGKPLVLRTAHQGRNSGAQFLGCSTYPACKGTLEL